ncbi:MAG: NAD(P)H-hydrate epimerase, partial [Rhodobacteraceae bacterium]|nr:NAD(P)H-hydrate epimerase [Paracoccaceae bacterium]
MTELLTAAQMRAIEQAAIDSGEVTGLELMERAGVGVVEAILEEWPAMAFTSHKAVVLCGPGNNGGDGFVVARFLKARGWEVEVFLYGNAEKLPVDAKVNCGRWREQGHIKNGNSILISGNTDLYVDALFGTGLTRPITGNIATAISSLKKYSNKTVSVDLPSGCCSDSGRMLGPSIKCRLCVTFERARVGHFVGGAHLAIGKLVVAKIGLSKYVGGYFQVNSDEPLVTLTKRSEYLGKKETGGSHKFAYGHALVLSGQAGKSGAARLTARGALRVGAGVVTVACPP